MGQYANQPDFATRAVGPISPSGTIDQTKFLDSAAIYVGTGGNLKVIMAGTTGASTVTKLVSPGYAGSGGTGYNSDEYDVSGGSGTGMTASVTAVNGVVVSVDSFPSEGSGYLNGDLVTIDATGSGNPGDDNAVFRIIAEPGLPTAADAVEFINIQDGSFVPVIVDYVLPATATAASDLVAIY
jgi:hypothetical protein